MTTIKLQNYSLVVFKITDVPLFESNEVATLLGYTQAGSLRKQTLSSWKDVFDEDIHYRMLHDEDWLRRYEKQHQDAGNGTLKAVKPTRGRLFFTPGGMLRVLNRTSKPSEELRAALMREGYFRNIREVMVVKDEPAPQPLEPQVPLSTLSKEDRMFEYEVMQKLLEQLERLEEPPLRGLAITAAETALGRKLEDLRFGEGVKTILEAAVPKQVPAPTLYDGVVIPAPRPIPEGPFFTDNDFYSMTRIGQMAGGYTAKTAGVAADAVGRRLGYTHDQVRNAQLPINQIAMRPDSSTGKKRRMVRFSMSFANKVIVELRVSPKLEPTLTQGVPTLSAFSGTTSHPLLSRGPFDEDGPARRS
jgi:hypothetical protein